MAPNCWLLRSAARPIARLVLSRAGGMRLGVSAAPGLPGVACWTPVQILPSSCPALAQLLAPVIRALSSVFACSWLSFTPPKVLPAAGASHQPAPKTTVGNVLRRWKQRSKSSSNFVLMFGRVCPHFAAQNGSKIGPKSVSNRSWTRLRFGLCFLLDFGAFLLQKWRARTSKFIENPWEFQYPAAFRPFVFDLPFGTFFEANNLHFGIQNDANTKPRACKMGSKF